MSMMIMITMTTMMMMEITDAFDTGMLDDGIKDQEKFHD